MGNSNGLVSNYTEEILSEYTSLTFLSRSEILTLYKTFYALGLDRIENINRRYSLQEIEECLPGLKLNPFKDRILRVFSSENDGFLSFEDMLDLYSVMSHRCPDKVKAQWVFRVFDYDGDGALGEEDLTNVSKDLGNQNSQIIEILNNKLKLEKLEKSNEFFMNELEFQNVAANSRSVLENFSFK